jgi:hypothetical protein
MSSRVICPQCNTLRSLTASGKIRRHACTPGDTDTVLLPWPRPSVSKNQLRRMHHMTEARARSVAVGEARWAIRAARPKTRTYADVTLHWRVPNRVRRDGDGAQWQLSVTLDALVREGILQDDSYEYVRHSGITIYPPQPGMPGAMWLEITQAATDQEEAS